VADEMGQPVLVADGEERGGLDHGQQQPLPPGRGRTAAVGAAGGEEIFMAFAQHRERALVTGKILRPAAGAVLPVAFDKPGDANAAYATLGERHPQVPILVAIAELIAAGLQQDLAAEERGEWQLVDKGDQPGIERVGAAIKEPRAAGPEQFEVPPGDARLRMGVERVRQGAYRSGAEQVVGIQRKDVGRLADGDTGHPRGGGAGVVLMQDADPRLLERVEEAQGCGIIGAIVDDDHLGRLLPIDGGERLGQKALVVVAGDDDGHPHRPSLRRLP